MPAWLPEVLISSGHSGFMDTHGCAHATGREGTLVLNLTAIICTGQRGELELHELTGWGGHVADH